MTAGQPLFDYKLGPGHAVDPRKQMGFWAARGTIVTHQYVPGTTYYWEVHLISGNYLCLLFDGGFPSDPHAYE